jgi:hypothetical protein
MAETIFSSNKKHLLFLGFELLAVSIAMFILINFKIISVQEITHYNLIASLILVLAIIISIAGFRKRYFIFKDSELLVKHKTTQTNISYKDIYLVRIFHPERTSQVTLGIVYGEDKQVFQISTSFFDGKVLLQIAQKLREISDEYEFLIEDEAGWLGLPPAEIIEDEKQTEI